MITFSEDMRRQAIDTLYSLHCSCVVLCADGSIEVMRQRGIRDLHDLLHDDRELLRGAFVADKVVGKGAAALMIAGGVEGLYTDVVSREALELLNCYGLTAEYATVADHIINRAGTGRCPVETLCSGLQSVEECLAKIDEFVARQKTESLQIKD